MRPWPGNKFIPSALSDCTSLGAGGILLRWQNFRQCFLFIYPNIHTLSPPGANHPADHSRVAGTAEKSWTRRRGEPEVPTWSTATSRTQQNCAAGNNSIYRRLRHMHNFIALIELSMLEPCCSLGELTRPRWRREFKYPTSAPRAARTDYHWLFWSKAMQGLTLGAAYCLT